MVHPRAEKLRPTWRWPLPRSRALQRLAAPRSAPPAVFLSAHGLAARPLCDRDILPYLSSETVFFFLFYWYSHTDTDTDEEKDVPEERDRTAVAFPIRRRCKRAKSTRLRTRPRKRLRWTWDS